MNNKAQFSDEELTAFLDGEFEHTPVEEIRQALKSDSGLQARLESLSLSKSEIDSAFDTLLDMAPAMPELPETTIQPPFRSLAKNLKLIAASALVFLTIGLGAGYYAARTPTETWRDYVAIYQALYINATLSAVEQEEEAATIELARVSHAIGKDVELSALVQQNQLDYKRAQILGFNGRPLMQLTFLSKTGEPIALCIIRSDRSSNGQAAGSNDTTITAGVMLGMQAASWSKDGYEYLLIGGRDATMINNAAKQFAKKL